MLSTSSSSSTAPDDEFLRQMEQDEVRLVGCVLFWDEPSWFCRDCDADILEDGWLAPSGEVTAELERLAELRADGVIDDDEFQATRKRLLDQGAPS